MTELRYNDSLFLWQYYVGNRDELEIEAELLGMLERDDARPKSVAAFRRALREIDRAKVSGEYPSLRERWAAPPDPRAKEKAEDLIARHKADFDALDNFLRGLESSDPEQRRRFREFAAAAGLYDQPAYAVYPLLRPLEPATGGPGRRRVNPPWRNEADALDRMRILISKGLNLNEAAASVAAEDNRPMTTLASRMKRLVKLYKQRVALRK